jgi:hypothetical protein
MTTSFDRFFRFVCVLSIAYVTVGVLPGSARADGIALPRKAIAACDSITLVCENARSYGLCPIGVTEVGELVTGTLTTPGPTYVRLMPMGNGYRYAGRGIWFDGKGPAGRLFFGPNRSVACAVEWH